MSDLKELQRIGLISKVCSELDNHLGFSDKTLAEFIIHLAETNNDANSFHQKLLENGADFPLSFATNLHRVISQITKLSENTKQASAAPVMSVPRNQLDIQFPALSRPNNSGPVDIDNLPNQEETWLKNLKESNVGKSAAASSSRSSVHDKKRERSPSYDRDRDRNRDNRRDSYDNNNSNNNNKYGSKSNERKDDNLELYKIYTGKITNILDFGCFVEIEGFFRKEGLVHIAQIQQGRYFLIHLSFCHLYKYTTVLFNKVW